MKTIIKNITLPIEMVVHIDSKNDIKKYIGQHNYFDKGFAKNRKQINKNIKGKFKNKKITTKCKDIEVIEVLGIKCVRKSQLERGCIKEIGKIVVCVLCAIVGEIIGGPAGAALAAALTCVGEMFIDNVIDDGLHEKQETDNDGIDDIDIKKKKDIDNQDN